ncbi:hypothetical protein NGM10_05705 [Halorussus salilacus]|uniref:hypothetical protein n=1 Tax=Halorussus salilacus TaxID=2953750 RepID=UPI0020A1631B|nr:hypothetical protein [Halorussus salilacus]USZ69235.1 hypothetical protein NGM10_05705 [Halorussus salilacus]
MNLPPGTLVRSRVDSNPSVALADALDRELTGYAVLEPRDALLLDADGAGVIGFAEGVPTWVHHTGTGRGGTDALADLAVPGPYSVELRAIPEEALATYEAPAFEVSPGLPADRLAGDPELADRTREAAPAERREAGAGGDSSLDAVEAFLDDEAKIEAIRDRAREEARDRAEQWGLGDELE